MTTSDVLSSDDSIYQVRTRVAGPPGALALDEQTVLSSPSGPASKKMHSKPSA